MLDRNSDAFSDLASEVYFLRRKVSALTGLVVVLLGLYLLGFVSGIYFDRYGHPDWKAENFVVLKDGEIRGLISASDDGALLSFSTVNGKITVLLGSDASGGSLGVINANGVPVVHVGSLPNGDGCIIVKDRFGRIVWHVP